MKSRITLLLGAVLLTPLIVVSTARAVDEPVPTTTTQTTPKQLTAEQKQKLQERVQQRKDAAKLRLTTAETKRIQTKCKNSQGLVRSLEGRISGIETSRNQVYTNLVDRLTKLEAKLTEKGANTTEFKAEIATLQTKIKTFNTDLAAYKVTVSDLAELDCVADPTAFKASLDAARTAQKKLHDDGTDIKTYVNETIKPTLKEIRATLAGEAKPEATTDTEAN